MQFYLAIPYYIFRMVMSRLHSYSHIYIPYNGRLVHGTQYTLGNSLEFLALRVQMFECCRLQNERERSCLSLNSTERTRMHWHNIINAFNVIYNGIFIYMRVYEVQWANAAIAVDATENDVSGVVLLWIRKLLQWYGLSWMHKISHFSQRVYVHYICSFAAKRAHSHSHVTLTPKLS